jgi:ATP-dependent RNA helicase DeaD
MEPSDTATFAQLGLRPKIVETLTALGYEAPTPIQERTIPRMLAGGDLIGQAQTGTGKTAAFSLPILEKIDPKRLHTQALVLTPTRELAMQVAEAIHSYAHGLERISVLPVYGGAPIVPQLKRLERGAHVVVGTPGRLIDHLERKTLDLSHLRVVVLDEADEMLKMGFADEVERILSEAPSGRQTALFSATMPDEVLRIAKKYLREPERIEIEHPTLTAPAIEQRFLNVSEGQKLETLTQILEIEPAEAVLIFRRTKNGAAELAEKLEARGFAAVAMHGDMSQPLRESVIRRLRGGQVEIVVATDVAARGLDVEQIAHVVNYDVPYDVEAYVHRIGRTGRAGRTGVATLFITPRERKMLREIERYTGNPIKPMKMPTRADVATRRIAVFKENVRKTITEGDLDLYLELVEQLVEEGPFDLADVAAAAARLANSARPVTRGREDEERVSTSGAPTPARVPASVIAADDARPARPPRDESVGKTVRLSMAVGKRDGIRPADIVGSIANEADVPGREIGPIEIREDITFVGVPERYVEVILAKVGRKKFRGVPLDVRVAPPGDFAPRERRRPQFDKPPSFRKRDDGDRPARRYEPRDDERPARRFEPRDGEKPQRASRPGSELRPRGPFRPRDDFQPRESRPRTDAKPRGTFKPREERPGSKRPFASRPGGFDARKRRDDSGPKPFYGGFKKGPKKPR